MYFTHAVSTWLGTSDRVHNCLGTGEKVEGGFHFAAKDPTINEETRGRQNLLPKKVEEPIPAPTHFSSLGSIHPNKKNDT